MDGIFPDCVSGILSPGEGRGQQLIQEAGEGFLSGQETQFMG